MQKTVTVVMKQEVELGYSCKIVISYEVTREEENGKRYDNIDWESVTAVKYIDGKPMPETLNKSPAGILKFLVDNKSRVIGSSEWPDKINARSENYTTVESFLGEYSYMLLRIPRKGVMFADTQQEVRGDVNGHNSQSTEDMSCPTEVQNTELSMNDYPTSFLDEGHDSMILGLQYEFGIDQEVNIDKAIENYMIAMEQGNLAVAFNIGWLYYCGVKQQDYSSALHYFTIAAQNSCSFAQFYLGFMYEKGLGVEVDLTEAKKWYELAYSNGHVEAGDRLKILTI